MNSVEIAKIINGKHKTLLEKIRNIIETLNNTNANIIDYFINSTYVDKQNKKRPCYECTKEGCYLIRDRIRGGRQKDLLTVALQESFENETITLIPVDRKEIEFLDLLEEALEPFDIKGERQYSILNYRIDYYIPKLNIAIEYDENEHKHYTYEAHDGRQLEIEKELGCRFVRVSDNKSNAYNIGYVIKELFY